MSEQSSAEIIRRLADNDRKAAREDASARIADRLEGIAATIRAGNRHPQHAVLVLATGTDSTADVVVHTVGCDLTTAVGLLDLGKMELYLEGNEGTN